MQNLEGDAKRARREINFLPAVQERGKPTNRGNKFCKKNENAFANFTRKPQRYSPCGVCVFYLLLNWVNSAVVYFVFLLNNTQGGKKLPAHSR
jgi:hypothetical protein